MEKNEVGNKKYFEKIAKNKKKIIFFILLILIASLTFTLYKVYLSKNDNCVIYENFSITKLTTKEGGNRKVELDSTFIVETDKKVNQESIRNRIFIEPSIDYEIKKVNSKKYEIVPTEGLVENQVYTIHEIKNETSVYKWAFETERTLSIIDCSPVKYAETDDVIQLTFSMNDVDNLEKYVSISPSIEGSWEKKNSMWIFKPKSKLKENTTYTVEVSKGLKAGNYTLKDNFNFTFTVGEYGNNTFSKNTFTLDEINSFTPTENPKIQLYDYEQNKIDVSLYKFSSIENFKNAVKEQYVDVKKLTKVYSDNLAVKKNSSTNNALVELGKTFETGYYAAVLTLNNYSVQQLIQITDIQHYVISTKNDTLVWTIKDGKVKSGVKVELNGKTVTSNKEGIAKFTNINNGNNDRTYVTIDKDSKYPAIVLVENYKEGNYPNGYIYTDRPLYKNTDTIKIWGYVPIDEFEGKVTDDFTLTYGSKQKKIKLDKNGTFTTEIKLNNNVDDDYFYIELYYKNENLAYRGVEIYDYVKPTYSYEINIPKLVYSTGETMKFDVYIEHITGIPAISKSVNARVFNKVYKSKTDSTGVAHFEIKVPFEKGDIQDTEYIEVYTGNYEDDNRVIMATKELLVLNYDITVSSEISGNNGNYNLSINAGKLDVEKITKESNGEYLYDLSKYIKDKYDTKATVNVYRETYEKVVVNTYYDDYEGKMVDEYEWRYNSELLDTYNVELKNGTATLKGLKYECETTANKNISYEFVISIKDTKGNVYEKLNYATSFASDSDENSDYSIYLPYSYSFESDDSKFSLNQTANYYLVNDKGDKINNKGQILTVFYKEGINKSTLTSDQNLSFKFSEDLFPGIYMAGAYLVDGKVYSIYTKYMDYNESDKELEVTITPDKSEYSPKDKVTLDITVKDKKGNSIETDLNISVVDETIFALKNDTTDLLSTIYSQRYYKMYQTSTNRKYYLSFDGGSGDVIGYEGRYTFKDTAFFKSVKTNKKGKATVSFKLPDNITKYRITAHAANKDEYLGVGTKSITSTQPFFIESVVPTNVKYNDDLVINAIAQGNNLTGKVEYVFKLDDKELKTTSNISEYASVNFGQVAIGEHNLTITAKSNDLTDKMSYKVKIVGNTQEVPDKTTVDITDKANIKETKSPITLEIYDKKLETYLKYLNRLTQTYSSRIDTQIAVLEASRLKSKYYDIENEFSYIELGNYQSDDNLVSKDKKSSSDVLLSAIVNKYAKMYFKNTNISNFNSVLLKEKASSKDIYSAYLGLASRNNITLSDLDYLKNNDKDRDIFENVILSLSYAFVGDYDASKEIYKSLKINVKNNNIFTDTTQITNDDILSLIAILTSMIEKQTSNNIIDILIDKNSTSMYLNFAIISYLENNTEEIEKNKTVTINYGKIKKKIVINGFKVEKITLDAKDLENINFSNASKDLKVTYYCTTGIDSIKSDKIKKDVNASISKEVKKSSEVNLNIKYNNNSKSYSELRVAIPHGLTLNKEKLSLNNKMYIINDKKDYIIIAIPSDINKVNINLPFVAINEGKYVIEPVIIFNESTYHISNKLNIKIK